MSDLKRRALNAINKSSPYGPDIDLTAYEYVKPRTTVKKDVEDVANEVGRRVGLEDVTSTSTYIQVDESVIVKALVEKLRSYGVIVTTTSEALEKIEWAKNYYWKMIDVDTDKYTAAVELYGHGQGYFIYVPPKTKIPFPIYACLFIASKGRAQLLHNIVIVDDEAELHLITGCAVAYGVANSLHVGVTEFYIGKSAKLSFAMLHAWSKGVHVRPRTAVHVDDGGEFTSYYILYSDVASLQAYPKIVLRNNAKTYTASVIVGWGESSYDVGSKAILEGNSSRAEITSRLIGSGKCTITSRACIIGRGVGCRGHIECLGLPLSNEVTISTIPELRVESSNAELTHEAAIGRLSEEELYYLMSRGFTEDEAKSLIVRGFMTVEVPGIPPQTRIAIENITKLIAQRAVG